MIDEEETRRDSGYVDDGRRERFDHDEHPNQANGIAKQRERTRDRSLSVSCRKGQVLFLSSEQ